MHSGECAERWKIIESFGASDIVELTDEQSEILSDHEINCERCRQIEAEIVEHLKEMEAAKEVDDEEIHFCPEAEKLYQSYLSDKIDVFTWHEWYKIQSDHSANCIICQHNVELERKNFMRAINTAPFLEHQKKLSEIISRIEVSIMPSKEQPVISGKLCDRIGFVFGVIALLLKSEIASELSHLYKRALYRSICLNKIIDENLPRIMMRYAEILFDESLESLEEILAKFQKDIEEKALLLEIEKN